MRVFGPWVIRIFATLSGALLLGLGYCRAQIPSSVQSRPDTQAAKDFAYSGEISVQVQETTGEPFFSGAMVRLFTQNVDARYTLDAKADLNGQARFTRLPIGMYLMEITAPGYRKVQQQVIITETHKAQEVRISLVPLAVEGKVKLGAMSVAPKAVKESEKALRALEGNRFEEAQEHLTQALVIDPNFADGNYLMGLVLLRKKDAARARAYLQRSVELAPEHAAAFLALGEADYLEHDYPHATDSLEKFLQAQPNSPQAPVARKYVDAMRKISATAADGGTRDRAGPSAGAAAGGSTPAGPDSAAALADLPTAAELDPRTESSWAPADVDEEKLDVDANSSCQLDEVVRAAGHRMQELVANVNRFTATESLEHLRLSPMGVEVSRESRKYKYVAEMRPIGNSDLEVQEYRAGSAVKQGFPDGITTVGLSSLAMIFHPNLARRYEFRCDGRGSWGGKPAWMVHFQQRSGEGSGMLTYNVSGRSVAVSLRGRAWIDAKSMQVVAMESDIVHPLPEIRLKRDHQLIEYGPVNFRKNGTELWLPKSADWYCSIGGKRFHRRHTFSQFLLFAVDDQQKISAPTVGPE
jgi:tetratricopeptide (TPR) repeat protein